MQDATYYVQFESPEEPETWHTIARVVDHALAEEVARLAESSFGRTEVLARYRARILSRSALRREGQLAHAEWELGMGHHRGYGDALLHRAERNLATVSR
ncbi:MAG TPA: hypothetical protein VH306_02590 [Gaiellaceae bacterium]